MSRFCDHVLRSSPFSSTDFFCFLGGFIVKSSSLVSVSFSWPCGSALAPLGLCAAPPWLVCLQYSCFAISSHATGLVCPQGFAIWVSRASHDRSLPSPCHFASWGFATWRTSRASHDGSTTPSPCHLVSRGFATCGSTPAPCHLICSRGFVMTWSSCISYPRDGSTPCCLVCPRGFANRTCLISQGFWT